MIFGFLMNFITGGALKTIATEIGQWQQRKLNAENAADRVEADQQIANLEARSSVLVAEAKHTVNQWFRAFIAIGPALYIFSYFAIDKVLCVKLGLSGSLCRVDAIDDPVMKTVMAAVIGFYFVTTVFDRKR